jgi:quercetin dioxygenase-like cupin family protein
MGELALGPNRVVIVAREAGFSLVEWRFAPPPAPGPPLHRHHREDEAFLVLAGELDVTIEETTDRLAPGGYAFVERMTWHTVANPGPAVCRFLVILSPPGLEGLWLETAALPRRTPEAILALQDRYGMETQGHVARRFE